MAVMDISVLPVGTNSPSVSVYVAKALKVLEAEPGIKYELTAMGTIIEGELDRLLSLAKRMHLSLFDGGAPRVVTAIRLDDRRDKPVTIEGKVKSVREKLRA